MSGDVGLNPRRTTARVAKNRQLSSCSATRSFVNFTYTRDLGARPRIADYSSSDEPDVTGMLSQLLATEQQIASDIADIKIRFEKRLRECRVSVLEIASTDSSSK